jgi:hypothetical protein
MLIFSGATKAHTEIWHQLSLKLLWASWFAMGKRVQGISVHVSILRRQGGIQPGACPLWREPTRAVWTLKDWAHCAFPMALALYLFFILMVLGLIFFWARLCRVCTAQWFPAMEPQREEIYLIFYFLTHNHSWGFMHPEGSPPLPIHTKR